MDILVKDDNVVITLNHKEVTGTSISVGKDYSYANLYAKVGDSEYFNFNYEWGKEGDVPDFVVGLMEFISKNKETSGAISTGAWKDKEVDYDLGVKASLDK